MNQVDKTIHDIERIFNAKAVAVVGASNDLIKFGGMTLDTIVRGGYKGRVYPVNPKADRVQGIKAYPSVAQIPDQLDAVLVIVPAKFVPEILIQAAEKGATGAVVMSAGFREAGRPDLEEEILSVARKHGLRLMGPNIQGFNYLPNRLCAMFMPVIDTRGPLAVVSQSGSVTTVLSEWAADEGLGISAAVNLGNQADLCETDYIDFFAQDENTKAIAMYLESVKAGGRFLEALERVSSRKPVSILKAGRTTAGIRATASHTGALTGSHQVFSSACRQSGATVAPDLETLYDQAKALATLGDLAGRRLAFVSSSGGANSIAVDEGEIQGFEMPSFPSELISELENLDLPPLAHLDNPVDLGSIDGDHYRKVALAIEKYDVADLVLMNFADPVQSTTDVVKSLKTDLRIPVAVSFMGGGEEEKTGRINMQRAGVPVFSSPERAMRGIEAAVWRAEHERRRRLD